MAKAPGLKSFHAVLSPSEVECILSQDEFAKNPGDVLFRYYGEFGHQPDGRGIAAPRPWMLEWGKTVFERGFLPDLPNQFRVTDWFGRLAAQFKWHIDNRRHGEVILAISLSDKRVIGFRKNADSPVFKLEQNAGDAYLIAGPVRWSWQHCVLPNGRDKSGGKSFVLSYRRPADDQEEAGGDAGME